MKAKYAITKLPPLAAENLEATMKERLEAVKGGKSSVPMLWQGLLELPIPGEGTDRSAIYYIPKDTPQGAALVMMNVPQGEQTIPFLEKSGWLELADERGICLFVLQPLEETWQSPQQEQTYVNSAMAAAKMGRHCMAAFAPYVVGYGPIGTLLHKAVIADPLHAAAAVFLDAGNIEKEVIAEYEAKEFSFPDRAHPEAPPLRVPCNSIPTPVWIVSESIDELTKGAAAYWAKAAKAGSTQEDSSWGTVYYQNEATEYTPEGNILKVAVKEAQLKYSSRETTDRIYAFLNQYYRYGMGPLSNAITKRVDLKTMGVNRHSFTDSHGNPREYLVYVPAAFRDGKGKLPTVVAFHGAAQTMENMLMNGLWYEIADREGIIVVYPEGSLQPMPVDLARNTAFANRPQWALIDGNDPRTEADFANELLDRLLQEYPVDEKRIYCTGHSMGCMITNYLSTDVTGHRFAAVGATSGCLMVRSNTAEQPIPAFMTIGQYDLWPYDIDKDSLVTAGIDAFLVQDGLASEETVKQVRLNANEAYQEGRYHHYIWKDAGGTPWVRYAWVTNKHHVHTYDENRILWEQWFSKWQIGEDGQRHYKE